MSSFLKQYEVSFWTTDGQLTSIIVGAMSPGQAMEIVKRFSNFSCIHGYPEEV